MLGTSRDLLTIVDQYRISDVVVAITGEVQGSTFQMLLDAQERGIEVTRMPIVYEEITQRVPIHHLESDWVIRSFVDQLRVSVIYQAFKRLLDILGRTSGLADPAAALALHCAWDPAGQRLPVLYSQDRLGKGGRDFTIYKFRTMRAGRGGGWLVQSCVRKRRACHEGWASSCARTHLDEFPQFWNVLRGNMSLVGPRAERGQLVAQFQKADPVLSGAPACQARAHRLGADQLRLRRDRARNRSQAGVRPVLHQTSLAGHGHQHHPADDRRRVWAQGPIGGTLSRHGRSGIHRIASRGRPAAATGAAVRVLDDFSSGSARNLEGRDFRGGRPPGGDSRAIFVIRRW